MKTQSIPLGLLAVLLILGGPHALAKKGGGSPKGWTKGEKTGWDGNQKPPGLARKEGGAPPGWTQGEKTGWEGGETPPGLAKKDAKKAEKGSEKKRKKNK